MKKLLFLTGLCLLSACADTAYLGYSNDVGVFYNSHPQNCQQIGMTILTISPFSGNLEKEIKELREEAEKIGGNYVNIDSYHYQAGLFSSNANHMTGTIYHCPKK